MRIRALIVAAALLAAFSGTRAAESTAAADLSISWQAPCSAPRGLEPVPACLRTDEPRAAKAATGDGPVVLCVPATDPGVSALGDYSTVQVAVEAQPERRFQLLPAEAGARHRVLVEASTQAVCTMQPASDRPVCGAAATGFVAAGCDDGSTPAHSCRLRPVPYDNPSFPSLPNPEVAAPGYFAPWPAYEGPGQMPGDLDKLFFSNVEALAPVAAGAADVLNATQRRQLELLAWQELVAMNWPVDEGGGQVRMNPAAGGTGGCPAWAGWRRRDEMMRGPRRLPIPWGLFPTANGSAPVCSGFRRGSAVAMVSATGGLLGERFAAGDEDAVQPDGHLLYDRNGLVVFYDIRVNRALYDYVLRQTLYAGGAPEGPVHFTHGQLWPPRGLGLLKAPASYEGPIAAKFAWKQLTSCDRRERFVVSSANLGTIDGRRVVADMRSSSCDAPAVGGEASGPAAAPTPEEKLHLEFLRRAGLVEAAAPGSAPADGAPESVPADGGPGSATADGAPGAVPADGTPGSATADPACRPVCDDDGVCLLGLVGLHIAHKTSSNALWNWATFVHRDAFDGRDGAPALFEGDGCDGDAARNCNDCRRGLCRTRVCLRARPSAATAQTNAAVQSMLATLHTPVLSVLTNYDLLGVQWLAPGTGDDVVAAPTALGNPLMETFVDGGHGGSCFGCHRKADQGDLLFFLHRSVLDREPAGPR